MQILGNGMLARSLQPYSGMTPATLAFACGVANSATQDLEQYQRELIMLEETLRMCVVTDTRLVYFSSGGAIYGDVSIVRDESTPTEPRTPYGHHKWMCENLIRSSDARYLIVRLANLVGSSQNAAQLVPALVNQVLSGRVRVQSLASRDLLDVDDFASILVRLLKVVPDRETLILASGVSVPIHEIVSEIACVLNRNDTVLHELPVGEPQIFSIAKLRGYLPDVSFLPDYFRKVVEKYVHQAEPNGA